MMFGATHCWGMLLFGDFIESMRFGSFHNLAIIAFRKLILICNLSINMVLIFICLVASSVNETRWLEQLNGTSLVHC